MAFNVAPIRDDLPFGARISGLEYDALEDAGLRAEIRATFEERGIILFEEVEPSGRMLVGLSTIFGELKENPVNAAPRVDNDLLPGIMDIYQEPGKAGIVELDGRQLSGWLPWHFDHCYNDDLNRGAILRPVIIPPRGGTTGFADGIALYQAISPELRERIEERNILYRLNVNLEPLRFGRPRNFHEIRRKPGADEMVAQGEQMPRAVHPAVWTRPSGEKVLHVSPWMALGIEGQEDAEGEALLHAVCEEIFAKVQPYFHQWRPNDMLVWDNWRVLHCASGVELGDARRMHRTTIRGDYGLGRFENGASGGAILEMTV